MSWTPYEGKEYLDFHQVMAWCEATAAAHPDWVKLDIIGTTDGGTPIPMLTIGDRSADPDSRPALWLDGGTHSAEWTGVMSALYSASQWVEALASGDPAATACFSKRTAYVVPCISPDGYQALHEGAPFMRSTLRPQPEGSFRSGLSPKDMTGDGHIRWMRWKHPAGSWVEDPDQPLFMRKRTVDDDPDDAYFFCDEGSFIAWDGTQWVDAPREFGLDLNRNFPGGWSPFRMFGMDGGAFPLSAPESRAVVDAVHARPNIAVAVTNHTYTGCILTQPYRKPSPLPQNDIDLMERMADQAVEGTGYRVIKVHPDFVYDEDKPIIGVWADSLCTTFAIPAYTLELWNPYAFAGVELDKPALFFQKPDPEIIRAIIDKAASMPGVTTPWSSLEHPQLGEVEIGGFDYMRVVRNPPTALLADECDRGHTVADRMLRTTPELIVGLHLDTHNGVTVLTATFENRGFLSTASMAHAEAIERVPPIAATLQATDGVQVIDGEPTQVLGHLDGWGALQVGFGQHAIYPSLGHRGTRTRARWVLQGDGELVVTWTAPRAGGGEARLVLSPEPQ
jgi:hypothetical protein